jgi:hypothetical protein
MLALPEGAMERDEDNDDDVCMRIYDLGKLESFMM